MASIFWLNVPVGLVALYLNHFYIEETKLGLARQIDWRGQLTIGLTLFTLTYGLIEMGRRGWNDVAVVGALGCAALSLCVFAALERRSNHPVLPGFLFSQPTFSVCVGVGFVLNFSMYGILFVESVYLQTTRGMDAFTTGLTITPFTLFPTLASRLLGKRNGIQYLRARISPGLALAAIGSGVLVSGSLSRAFWLVPLGLGLLGISMGIIMPAMTAGVLLASAPENAGLAFRGPQLGPPDRWHFWCGASWHHHADALSPFWTSLRSRSYCLFPALHSRVNPAESAGKKSQRNVERTTSYWRRGFDIFALVQQVSHQSLTWSTSSLRTMPLVPTTRCLPNQASHSSWQ